jgi:hypothetical protein
MIKSNIVTITRVGTDWVDYSAGRGERYSISNQKFPGAEVGQTWEVITDHSGQYPTGKVISAVLRRGAKQPRVRSR